MDTPPQLPFDYVRDDVRRRIRVTVNSSLTANDFLAIVDRQMRERTWNYAMLYDLRAERGVSRADGLVVAARVRAYVKRHGTRGPVAVCARTIEALGASQRYAIEVTEFGLNVEVFSDLKAAEDWLDQGTGIAPGL